MNYQKVYSSEKPGQVAEEYNLGEGLVGYRTKEGVEVYINNRTKAQKKFNLFLESQSEDDFAAGAAMTYSTLESDEKQFSAGAFTGLNGKMRESVAPTFMPLSN